jgi:hypothetical protein
MNATWMASPNISSQVWVRCLRFCSGKIMEPDCWQSLYSPGTLATPTPRKHSSCPGVLRTSASCLGHAPKQGDSLPSAYRVLSLSMSQASLKLLSSRRALCRLEVGQDEMSASSMLQLPPNPKSQPQLNQPLNLNSTLGSWLN